MGVTAPSSVSTEMGMLAGIATALHAEVSAVLNSVYSCSARTK